MDLSEATKILLDKIQKLEPEIAPKIMGLILLQNQGQLEMIRLANAPETYLENLVQETKVRYLGKPPVSGPLSTAIAINPPQMSDVRLNCMPFSPNGSRPYTSQPTFRVPLSPYWDLPTLTPDRQSLLSSDFASYGDPVVEDYGLQSQARFSRFEDQLDPISVGAGTFAGDVYYPDAASGNLSVRTNRRLPSSTEFPIKKCHYYFSKGSCKHGSSCRYWHGLDNSSPIFSHNEIGIDDHMFSPGSLEKLELEINELLKSRRGNPVSIASLPMLYYEKYGRTLQADGYLTESQRHGRPGFSLKRLLDQFKSLHLDDRPHGQHWVVLAEDASKYNAGNRSERNYAGDIVSESRQIYLTFPAESTFTEKDVSNYFGTFGTVEDVRIPCQEKRMFGFVTFASANTVKTVLNKGNPHFVCGARVLVKPYREKSKVAERKCMVKNNHDRFYHGNYSELEHDFHPLPRCEAPRFLRRQMLEEQEQALEMETRRLSELQLGRNNFHNRQFVGYGMEELNSLEDRSEIPSAEQYHYLMDVINNSSVSDDRSTHLGTDYTGQERYAKTLGNNYSEGNILNSPI